jgi:hypothetical protein
VSTQVATHGRDGTGDQTEQLSTSLGLLTATRQVGL